MMKTNKTLFTALLFNIVIAFSFLNINANNATYLQRQSDYIDSLLLSPTGSKLILQAAKGLPLDSLALNAKLNEIATRSTSDFVIVELIRILFIADTSYYDSQILPVILDVPYWINYGDTLRNYWSENHMIMWMSCDWLLHEKYSKPIDGTLRNRLVHYLELKIQYGYYEFFSSTYAPYALSGLLNLADFAQDAQIKNLASKAAQKLLSDLLMLTNDKGVFFPVAGRNYFGSYNAPYGKNHNNLIYLLTGMGQHPAGASHSGQFLSTSSLEVDSVIASWTAELNTVYSIGHSLDTSFILNSAMSHDDRIVFQWSAGAYFHPDVVFETTSLLVDSNLWDQVDFALLKPLSVFPPQDFPAIAENLSCISKSSVIAGQDIAIFKHNSITLSSVLDFWKGKVGFQQFPCVVNVGTSAVFTVSGQVLDWPARNDKNENIHLPYVDQENNVALIMYRPEPKSQGILPSRFNYEDVSLYWNDADYEEVIEDSSWLIGRQENSYVAVRRSCNGNINGFRACETEGGQTWVFVVGDSVMYGSFSNFKNIIHQSQFQESWIMDTVNNKSIYYAKINVDTISIDYAWEVDSTLTGIHDFSLNENPLKVYPNPSNNLLNIDISSFVNESVSIKAFNTVGDSVYADKLNVVIGNEIQTINSSNWSQGIYLIVLESENGRFTRKVIKSE